MTYKDTKEIQGTVGALGWKKSFMLKKWTPIQFIDLNSFMPHKGDTPWN